MRARRGSGLTVLEVAVSAALFSAILLVAAMAARRSFQAWGEMLRVSDIEQQAQAAVETIAGALADAGRSTVTPVPAPPLGGSSVTFRTASGFAASATTWGDAQTVEWRPGPADPVNGVDDDGNGVVDDGVVVWRRAIGTAGENTVVLANCVPALAPGESANSLDDNGDGLKDERGLSFALVGTRMRVRLAVSRRTSDGTLAVRVAERTLAMRN